ncbi:MAG TPA: HNH endonuclease signature motif containing protein [Candidatus Binatia bacterium]
MGIRTLQSSPLRPLCATPVPPEEQRVASPAPSAPNVAPVDPFALDARLVAARHVMQTSDARIGRLLRVIIDHHFYRLLGVGSVDAYVRERLGISSRKAWALVRLEKASFRGDEFARAYADGSLSWTRALALLPILTRDNAGAWVARARAVTVRRLFDEVNHVLESRDLLGPGFRLHPPPIDDPLTSPVTRHVHAGGHEHELSLASIVQIGAQTDSALDGARAAHPEVCDAAVSFTGPASVVALLRDVLDAFAVSGAPRWAALERLLLHVITHWENTPRHRDPIFARDGWRCAVPACSSRRNLHDHHLLYRSRGGGNEGANRVAVCAAHHLHAVHTGVIRAWGSAPADVHWELGVRRDAPPLLAYVGERRVPAPHHFA